MYKAKNKFSVSSDLPLEDVQFPIQSKPSEHEVKETQEKDSDIGEANKLINKGDFVKLSGARKKRFNWYRNQGHTVEEALELSVDKMSNKDKTSQIGIPKKNAQEGRERLSSRDSDWKRYKPNHSFPNNKSSEHQSADTSSGLAACKTGKEEAIPLVLPIKDEKEYPVKIGILPVKYPEEKLNDEQLEALEKSILEKVLDAERGINPVLEGTSHKSGWLMVFCNGKCSADWLKGVIKTIKPWDDAELKAVEDNDLPRTVIYSARFPLGFKETSEKILEYLKTRNNKIYEVDSWEILSREDSDMSTHITFGIDISIAALLGKEGALLSYKFGQVVLRPITGN